MLLLLVAAGFGIPRAFAAEPFFFIQLTDPQFGMAAKDANFEQETANLEFAVAAVNRLKPAFVVVTGDLVNKPGDAAQIAEYKRILAKVRGIPVYSLPGNHDVGNAPTPQTLMAYTNQLGADHYTFEHGGVAGVVLNSGIIHTPDKVQPWKEAQDKWLKKELTRLNGEKKRILVFQHHSWFLNAADEPDEYFNIPRAVRGPYLTLLREAGVKQVFCGHLHRNCVATDGDLEVITTGPVGQPLGKDSQSGFRIVIVRDTGIEHRFYEFGEIPNQVSLK